MITNLEKFTIKGQYKLTGEVFVSGSKNVALKALVAACLTDEEIIIENVPLISDLLIMVEIIKEIGGTVKVKDHSISIRVKSIKTNRISLDKAAEIRTSFMFLAPLLARSKKAIIPNPGGCRIGARPINRIVDGLKKMGATVDYDREDGYFHTEVNSRGLQGTDYTFTKSTHTGTETMMLSSVLAKGKTILRNAGQEPEIDELISFLNKMGAKIRRVKPRIIEIEGVKKLHGTKLSVSPDRNEIVTLAIAAIITKGDIFVKNIDKTGILEFLKQLKKAGGGYELTSKGIRFFYKGELKPTKITTNFYPGFMTDWQGPWTILMTKAKGASAMHETVYENRFTYVHELEKMGARIELFNPKVKDREKFYNFNVDDDNGYFHAAKIYGPRKLHNAVLNVTDLRAGATLVLAALAAKGESIIFGIEHLDRGYEKLDERLKSLGAEIVRSQL
ncbi:MAG: UDP-N-acetylglucosamine 1-carboxyvinyltransferase [Actinobacteria bacterium]|nr:UDP-N-acetylglucosamine 1-carboxyvinyltransferase [Actinomycetota bacterium]